MKRYLLLCHLFLSCHLFAQVPLTKDLLLNKRINSVIVYRTSPNISLPKVVSGLDSLNYASTRSEWQTIFMSGNRNDVIADRKLSRLQISYADELVPFFDSNKLKAESFIGQIALEVWKSFSKHTYKEGIPLNNLQLEDNQKLAFYNHPMEGMDTIYYLPTLFFRNKIPEHLTVGSNWKDSVFTNKVRITTDFFVSAVTGTTISLNYISEVLPIRTAITEQKAASAIPTISIKSVSTRSKGTVMFNCSNLLILKIDGIVERVLESNLDDYKKSIYRRVSAYSLTNLME